MLVASTLVGSYYSHVSRLFNIYVNHCYWIFVANIVIVLGTLIYMSVKHGYTGESVVSESGGEEYLLIPLFVSILTWIGVGVLAVFLYVLPVLFLPYWSGVAGRRFKDWLNKPEPSPFVGQKLEPHDFEVKNDWRD
jgi:hypothetical protein